MAQITVNLSSTTPIGLNGGDRLIVTPTGGLFTTSSGVTFAPVTPSTVDLSIFGTVASGGFATSIFNATLVDLIVGPNGSLTSDAVSAVFVNTTKVRMINAGSIFSSGVGAFNAGLLITQRDGSPDLTVEVSNSGTISGAYGIQINAADVAGAASIVNTGRIVGLESGILLPIVETSTLPLTLSNSGAVIGNSRIEAAVETVGDAEIDNTGTIQSPRAAAVQVGGTLNLKNSGTISGDLIAIQASKAANIENDGKIVGKVLMTASASDRVINTGTINGSVETSGGADTVRNSGTIGGDIELQDGDDTYLGQSGHVANGVSGGGGNDFLLGGDRDDTFSGGTGNDDLRGGGGDDDLHGEEGNDIVRGGSGDDQIFGDKGRDSLRGGSGADDFVYLLKTDSTGKFFDTIADFQRGVDHIDLTAVGGKKFIGTSGFGGTVGEVRFKTIGTDAMVFVDLTGNKKPDMKILLDDIAQLSADDFLF